MTYRHHSLRCHHRVQNTQGSNEHQLRITCQACQGHLAIVYGQHLSVESRRLIKEHLDATPPQDPAEPPPAKDPAEPPPVQRPQPLARAAAAMGEPQGEPKPAGSQEDVEVDHARMAELNQEIRRLTAELEAWRKIELNQEIRKLTAEVKALPRQAPPPQAQNPPEANPEEMLSAQGSPRQQRPHP